MFTAYKRYFDFHGRGGRSEYWLFSLWTVILYAAAAVVDVLIFGDAGDDLQPISLLVILGHIIPSLSAGFRRLHDTNRTAWWTLLGAIPILGILVLILFYALPGTPGENRFGPPADEPVEDLEATFS